MSALSPPTERSRSLHARLLALTTGALAPPAVDPRIAALAALGLIDFARSDQGRARFAELAQLGGFDPASLDDLELLSEALLRVVEQFDAAPRAPKPIAIPQPLEIECRARRGLLATLLSERLSAVPAVDRALRHLRLAYGPLDLAVDLRSLAALIETHAGVLDGAPDFTRELPGSTRALAATLEARLHSADTPQLHQARGALHRMWALFETSYRSVAELGREIFVDRADDSFPTLEAIARIERVARRESSSRVPAAAIVEESIPSSRRAMARRPSSRRIPAVRPSLEAVPPLRLDVVMNATSESNLWLGFAQDLAEGGVFVATYEDRPLGARVELTLHVEGDAPIPVAGQVHWLRPQSAGDDLPVGFGVRLLDVDTSVVKRLQGFAVRRTPIFYDD